MRILVTGVSGFAGAWAGTALAQAGHDVAGLHRRDTRFCRFAAENGVRLIRRSLDDTPQLSEAFEAVIHAGATSPSPGVHAAQIAHDNVAGTAAIISAARQWDARHFVFFSSISLYGEVAQPILDEHTPIVNPDIYGASKLMDELMLADSSADLPALVLRLPGVIGPGAHRNWLSTVAAKLRAGEAIAAYNLDSPFNNAVHIDDVARLIVEVLRCGWSGFDAVVLGVRSILSVRDVIGRLARGLHTTARIERVVAPKRAFTLCSDRAIERWNYNPMTIGETIDRYASDLQQYHSLDTES